MRFNFSESQEETVPNSSACCLRMFVLDGAHIFSTFGPRGMHLVDSFKACDLVSSSSSGGVLCDRVQWAHGEWVCTAGRSEGTWRAASSLPHTCLLCAPVCKIHPPGILENKERCRRAVGSLTEVGDLDSRCGPCARNIKPENCPHPALLMHGDCHWMSQFIHTHIVHTHI